MKIILLIFCLTFTSWTNCFGQDTPDKILSIEGKVNGKPDPGKTVEAQIFLNIKKGWHINSNQPFDKNLVATAITFTDTAHYKIEKIEYPQPIITNLAFSEDELALFEDEVTIKFSIRLAKNFKGDKLLLKGEVRYQPCNDQACLFPYTKQFSIELK